jgi:hypothetical protein
MNRLLLFFILLLLIPVSAFAQESLTSIGVGAFGGITISTNRYEIGPVIRLSTVLDRFTRTYNRIWRTQWDLGTWASDEDSDEWYGRRYIDRRIVHLSMSAQVLFGGEVFHFIAGFGASLLFVGEETFEDVDEASRAFWEGGVTQSSYVSAAFFPLLGICRALTRSLDILLEARYELVLNPVSAGGLAITAGLLFVFL